MKNHKKAVTKTPSKLKDLKSKKNPTGGVFNSAITTALKGSSSTATTVICNGGVKPTVAP